MVSVVWLEETARNRTSGKLVYCDAFYDIDILRYGGEIPGQKKGTAVFACPDVDTLNVFRIERIEEKEQ